MFVGKVVIVTGGAGHIGKGVCHALTKAGWTVACIDIQKPDKVDFAAKLIIADLTKPEAAKAAVDEIIREFGGVDALVNMAQKTIIGIPLAEVTDTQMLESYITGPMTALRMMQLCRPHMIARGGGSIVNFASDAGTAGNATMGPYGAAKEGMRGLTKIAATEWGPDNIRVNTLCPVAFADPDSDWARDSIRSTPLNRVGRPEEIGEAVAFLAGPVWITGRTIHVDGGLGRFR
jgi:NAD(P)-dependent dehydrogenase (short-subunit alcohol dehydrogenase family)